MKNSILFISLLLSFSAFSQNYLDMLNQGNTWGLEKYTVGDEVNNTATFQVTIRETVVINNTNYKRAYNFDEPKCLLREENGIVYKYDEDLEEERVMLDFTLEVGDTFSLINSAYDSPECYINDGDFLTDELEVTDVSYVAYAGDNRKVITFQQGTQSTYPLQWIEGIGTTSGFDDLFGFEYPHLVIHSELKCFRNINGTAYFNGVNSCVLGTNPVSANSALITPNPVSDIATLTLPLEINKAKVLFLNVYGKIIYEQHISEKDTALDLSALHSGMYFYQIYSENELILSKKLIVK